MIVFFRARTKFSAPITRDFWRKLREHKDPFLTLEAVGGSHNGNFSGTISLNLKRRPSKRSMAYEITAALVQKVELLSKVGVAHIEFDEITVGIE